MPFAAALMNGWSGQLLAHGIGSRGDLPLPFWQFAWASSVAIAVSFFAVGEWWSKPKLAAAEDGNVLGGTRALMGFGSATARATSLVLFFVTLGAALFGSTDKSLNIAPVAVFVALWVVVQGLVCFLGNFWPSISPFETIGLAFDRVRSTSTEAPVWTHWLAPVAAAAFLFMELIHPNGAEPRNIGYAMVIYTALVLAGVWKWGRGWLAKAELFTVHFGLMSAMAPLARDESGAIRVRVPLSGLAKLDINRVGTTTLLVVLGGVTFDGLGESELFRDLIGRQSGWTEAGYRFAGIVVVTLAVSALYLVSIRSMAKITGQPRPLLANLFAPSLVPILFGYTIAHYLQLAFDEMQNFVFRLSDPFGQGWDLFGGAEGVVNFNLVSVDAVAWFQALAVVIGHIAGILVAHDRAVGMFDRVNALRSQFVMLFVMVLYSILGLWLLLNA